MTNKAKHVLNVSDRAVKGSAEARRVRAQGLIPAVIYSKGATGRAISVPAAEWEALSQHVFNIVSLEFEGGEEVRALLKDTQRNFIKGTTSHIDFLEIRKDVAIEAEVPVHPGFEQPVGCSRGGLLDQVLHTLKVECLPDALPELIEVDVSKMEVGDLIHVSELVLPEGVTAKSHGDLVVFEVIDSTKMAEDIPEAPAPAEGDAAAEPEIVGAKEKAERAAEREEAKKK